MEIKPIAIYLPQFHPIPENDQWWGKGFTEWTNVTKANPLFKNHYQPHLPADLGFYDLRLEEARLAQETLAKEYNIYGFCYYHYWFNGKRILHEPLDRKIKNPKEDLPFMICWANENWTRVWDGSENNILLEQKYGENDDRNHIQHLLVYLKDPRYIKFQGKHVLAIYKSELLPDPQKTIRIWKEQAKIEGIDLLLCRMDAHGKIGEQFLDKGFDRSIDFQPFGYYFDEFKKMKSHERNTLTYRFIKKIKSKFMSESKFDENISLKEGVFDYGEYVKYYCDQPPIPDSCFPCVTPSWDNSSRKRKNFLILKDSNPDIFSMWIEHILKSNLEEDSFLFINAWNEWAEGNHLEPCQKWGRQYLEKLKNTISKSNEIIF
jgi:lipopolysaccharide biosynthesis protein